MSNDTIFTGKLTYKDIDFTFVFDGNELRLIPPKDKEKVVGWDWKMEEIKPGAFTFASPKRVEEPYLVGECNEKQNKIVFLPDFGQYISTYNYIVVIHISAYIVFSVEDRIGKMSFHCPELNYIHPTSQALTYKFQAKDFSSNGTASVSTEDFNSTTTDKTSFVVGEKKIDVNFSTLHTISYKDNHAPITVDSVLVFSFDPTDDYEFIYRLWKIARDFIRFLCYRKNVFIPIVTLSKLCNDGRYQECAMLHTGSQDEEPDLATLQKGKYIKQKYISGKEGAILSDIASHKIYLRHIPESYESGRHIDAARFVMITAAFEWEFKRAYPTGIKKSSKTLEAENQVNNEISDCIKNSSGKKKEVYKHLKKQIGVNSLASEIIQVGKDYSSVIDIFGKYKYGINHQELDYSKMGARLSQQRNSFAHGKLEQDFIGNSLLDLIFLENVIYAMQLKYYNIPDLAVQKAINDLFSCRIAIKEAKNN